MRAFSLTDFVSRLVGHVAGNDSFVPTRIKRVIFAAHTIKFGPG